MTVQYITDDKGKKTGVLVSMSDWKKIQKKLDTGDDEWLEDISDEEKAAIETGIKQLGKGEGIPHREAIKRLKRFPK